MSKALTVSLTNEQRTHLHSLIHAGNAPARTQTRARILLLTDRSQGTTQTDAQVAEAVLCCPGTVGNVRRQCVREGMDAALADQPWPGRTPKITGDIEAHLVTLACSQPPEGQVRWTLRLLAGRVVELGLLASLSHVAVGDRLKKMNLSPGR